MRDAGLSIREDPMGNIYGRMAGSSSTGRVVLSAYLALRWPPALGACQKQWICAVHKIQSCTCSTGGANGWKMTAAPLCTQCRCSGDRLAHRCHTSGRGVRWDAGRHRGDSCAEGTQSGRFQAREAHRRADVHQRGANALWPGVHRQAGHSSPAHQAQSSSSIRHPCLTPLISTAVIPTAISWVPMKDWQHLKRLKGASSSLFTWHWLDCAHQGLLPVQPGDGGRPER